MSFFTLFPILYLLLIVGLLVFFFWIINEIRKSNDERNEILRDIHEELKNANKI